jgi:hypothetical protein
MKAALDLTDDLVREVKIHAIRSGRKLKDTMADLLRLGLDASGKPPASATIVEGPATGLPVVVCRHSESPSGALTPGRVADILLEQEAERVREPPRRERLARSDAIRTRAPYDRVPVVARSDRRAQPCVLPSDADVAAAPS